MFIQFEGNMLVLVLNFTGVGQEGICKTWPVQDYSGIQHLFEYEKMLPYAKEDIALNSISSPDTTPVFRRFFLVFVLFLGLVLVCNYV